MKDEGDGPAKQPSGTSPADGRLNQTLKGMQNLLSRGRTLPGKIMLSRKNEAAQSSSKAPPPEEEIVDDYVDVGKGGDASVDRGSSQASTSDRHNDDGNDGGLREEPGSARGVEGKAGGSQHGTPRTNGGRATDSARVDRFKKVLATSTVELEALRELAWSGVPPDMRPACWRLLLGYAPPNSDRRAAVLARKRQEYRDCVPQYYDIPNAERSEDEVTTLRQISVDVPRTVPDVRFFQESAIQGSLTRILYIWAIRHPASGYVQGINDLVTPFLAVFLSEILEGDMEQWDAGSLSPETLYTVEADCYWCLCKLLDGIQDHYTFAQPGIQRLVFKLKELVRRIDEPVARRIEEQGLEFLQFAFRWFNCLLIRELPFHLVCRLWDTYLAEGDGFADFLVYVCASFLLTWSDELQKLEFQDMVLFLQHLPTKKWTHQELEIVLSRAYMWREMFGRSPNHLNSS